ncbi:MAG: homogentisate 1,2-dioxygenase [Bacteroidota bacterium]|jgi:homogentisate 1,2-dioxygenase
MPQYHKQGSIPRKRHTQFRNEQGKLYAEELVSTHGFSNIYSLIYHCHPPTMVKSLGEPFSREPKIVAQRFLKHQSFLGFNIEPEDDYMESKKAVLVNNDLHISLAAPRKSISDYYLKNADADEVIFVHKGSGVLKTIYGDIDFGYGDYLVIPRGTTFQLHFNDENNRLFIIDSFTAIEFPKRYLNNYGQFEEHAPMCERDIRRPESMKTHNETGDFKVMIKKQGIVYPYIYATHPFDAIGWDGNLYPYAFNIQDFEPITGRLHLPPPIHQTFEAHNFVICSFVPRMYDYHPQSIPAPYNHSNVDSDEVLYYVDGDFMSRKSVIQGQITLHPAGIPHGPHPGTVEKSIGQKETKELAVMVDTFKPLWLTEEGVKIMTDDYYRSWIE